MTANEEQLKVVGVDQVFPFLTTEAASRSTSAVATVGDQGPVVTSVLRDVLGWRPRVQDSKAFIAALNASFQLTEFEGHIESAYVARGFAMNADLGFVSGGQASLLTRARAGYDQMGPILDSLTPLRPDADSEDCEAFRLVVRHQLTSLVQELGNPGGPRQALVNTAFTVLAGFQATGATGGVAVNGVTGDNVPGTLGALRDRFGLTDANCNTVEDERVRTSYWTLVDLVLDLRRSWQDQKGSLLSGAGSGFLGTDLVVISRLMAAAAEQVDEVEAVLDSVLVSAAERQTLMLTAVPGLTLDGLLSWMRDFLTKDGPMYIRDSGRDGILTAFAPQLQALLDAFHTGLMPLVSQLAKETAVTGTDPCCPVMVLPASCYADFPAGMYSARSRIALAGLCRLLRDLFDTAARLSRYPGIVLFEVEFQRVQLVAGTDTMDVRVTLRGANLRSSYLPAFVHSGIPAGQDVLQLPLNDSATADTDTLTGVFRFSSEPGDPALGDGWPVQVMLSTYPSGVVLPAQAVPIGVVDGETGRVITASPTRTWPTLAAPPTPYDAATLSAPIDWSNVEAGRPFTTSFASSSPIAEAVSPQVLRSLREAKPADPQQVLSPPASPVFEPPPVWTTALNDAVDELNNSYDTLLTTHAELEKEQNALDAATDALEALQNRGASADEITAATKVVARAQKAVDKRIPEHRDAEVDVRQKSKALWALQQPTFEKV